MHKGERPVENLFKVLVMIRETRETHCFYNMIKKYLTRVLTGFFSNCILPLGLGENVGWSVRHPFAESAACRRGRETGTRTKTSKGPAVSEETSRFPGSLKLWSTGNGAQNGLKPEVPERRLNAAGTGSVWRKPTDAGECDGVWSCLRTARSCKATASPEVEGREGESPREDETQES